MHPVFFGSAMTGAGVPALMAGIRDLLPAAAGDPAAPVSGSVFKVERGPAGEKIAYARLFDGTLRVRDRVAISGDDEEKVTAIGDGRERAAAGEIGRLWGLAACASATRSASRAPPRRTSTTSPRRRSRRSSSPPTRRRRARCTPRSRSSPSRTR